MTSPLRLLLAGLLATTAVATSAEPAAQVTPELAAFYTHPQRQIDVGDGRKLNLVCLGPAGGRTVLFDAGGSDWSVIWALVQPVVARTARACAYDRAGLGYSDAVPGPRSPYAIVEDLHALVHAAGLEAPLVLVGHSLGGFNVKLYAALYPEDVAGLVLVDPAEDRSGERIRVRARRQYGPVVAAKVELAGTDGLVWLLDRYRACRAAVEDGDLDPASPTYRRCSDPVRPKLGPEIAAERARLQVTKRYQTAQASEILNSVYAVADNDPVYASLFRPGAFGAKPLVVLSHGEHDAGDPVEAADFATGLWLHAETAALSRRGVHRIVPKTSHNIEIDDPAAIVGAVNEVLAALPNGR